MSARQVGFVVLVAMVGLLARQVQVVYAAPAPKPKCNAGCWNMQSTAETADWQFEGLGICYSYYNGPQATNIHAPFERMGTTKVVGGVRIDMLEQIQEYKTVMPCDNTCIGTTPVEATPSTSDYRFSQNVERYACFL